MEPPDSLWRSPPVLVPKPDGSQSDWRACLGGLLEVIDAPSQCHFPQQHFLRQSVELHCVCVFKYVIKWSRRAAVVTLEWGWGILNYCCTILCGTAFVQGVNSQVRQVVAMSAIPLALTQSCVPKGKYVGKWACLEPLLPIQACLSDCCWHCCNMENPRWREASMVCPMFCLYCVCVHVTCYLHRKLQWFSFYWSLIYFISWLFGALDKRFA